MTEASLAATRPAVHVSRLRVYYEDTDAGGIVYHANYLRYFERARTDWLRALGVEHRRLAADHGLGFVVREARIDYLHGARLDDQLDIDVRVGRVGRASVQMLQQAHRVPAAPPDAPRLLARAELRIAVIELAQGRPAAMPAWLYQRLCE